MKKSGDVLTWICVLILLVMAGYSIFRELAEIRFLMGR